MSQAKHIVLLLAGGCGQRMHSDRPKQFMEIEGEPIICHTMRAFETHEGIDHIYIVCAQEWNEFVTSCARSGGISKYSGTFPAGETSFDSLRNGVNGLNKVFNDTDNPAILVHEAVRPLVTADTITQNILTFHTYGNAITGIRSNEAYMMSYDGIRSENSLPRETLFRAQTPQTFSLNELTSLFQKANEQGIKTSQSLFTLIREILPHQPLFISPGSELNFKITHPEDIETLKAIMTYQQRR